MPTVLIPLAEGCEELEAVTVIDILRRAGINVIAASLGSLHITASRGTRLTADQPLEKVLSDEFDMVILPGGLPGAEHLNTDPRIHTLLQRIYHQGGAVAAICAAPMVFAHSGLAKGKTITCYPGALKPEEWPDIVINNDPIVIDGTMITSRGPGTALDFALTLVEYLSGKTTRNQVEAALVR